MISLIEQIRTAQSSDEVYNLQKTLPDHIKLTDHKDQWTRMLENNGKDLHLLKKVLINRMLIEK